MSTHEPIQPDQIVFHLTGFQTGKDKVAFGASLATAIFAEMRNIMQAFEKSMQGGVAITQKLKGVDVQVQELMKEIQELGTVPMNATQIAAWVAKFKQTGAAAKEAIEALGNPAWIKMLDKSLTQVQNLVKSTSFMQIVQNTAKQIVYLKDALEDVMSQEVPSALKIAQAMEALQSDATALGDMGKKFLTIGKATDNPALVNIGTNFDALGKTTQNFLNNLFAATPGRQERPHFYGRFGDYYNKWLQDTQKGDTAAAKKDLQTMEGWWAYAAQQSYTDWDVQWNGLIKQTNGIITQIMMMEQAPTPPNLSLTLLNDIETGKVEGIYFTDFPQLDNDYKSAISSIQSMEQVGTQFSKESITTLNSLMTGMTAVIKNFNKAMMQSQRSVNLAITDINKRK